MALPADQTVTQPTISTDRREGTQGVTNGTGLYEAGVSSGWLRATAGGGIGLRDRGRRRAIGHEHNVTFAL
jgi:hypothetical protein